MRATACGVWLQAGAKLLQRHLSTIGEADPIVVRVFSRRDSKAPLKHLRNTLKPQFSNGSSSVTGGNKADAAAFKLMALVFLAELRRSAAIVL
jgi:hypothetical protein